MQRLKGHIVFSCPQGITPRGECDYINIAITDELSGIQFIEIEVPYANFAQALTGSHQDCDFELRPVDHVGMKLETKHERVSFDCKGHSRKDDAPVVRAAIAEYEIDGWKGYDRDAFNSHKRAYLDDGRFAASVSFRRFVPV